MSILLIPPEGNDHVDESTARSRLPTGTGTSGLKQAGGVATVPAHNVPVADSLVNRVKHYYREQDYENK